MLRSRRSVTGGEPRPAGTLLGNQDIRDAVDVHGVIAGDVVVRAGGDLVVRGTVRGCLDVRAGGRAVVIGTITENVTNTGGTVDVCGVVGGRVVALAGETLVREGAIVGRGAVPDATVALPRGEPGEGRSQGSPDRRPSAGVGLDDRRALVRPGTD